MLRDVTHTVIDGQLGIEGNSGVGVHIKIGVSPVRSLIPIEIRGNSGVNKIREKLGFCPLADKVMDSIEYGAEKILCIPIQGSIAGITNKVDGEENSVDAVAISGNPYNAFTIILKIISSGTLNVAAFVYSIDGGYSYSDTQVVPINGQYEIPNTGLTVLFGSEGAEFVAGDSCSWLTTAPKMTNAQIIQVVGGLKNIKTEFEYVHIVGESNLETWVSVSELQQSLFKAHIPLLFIMEAYQKTESQSLDEYVAALQKDALQVKNYGVQVVTARMLYKGMDGIKREINASGIIAGLYARVSVNKSIGETAVIHIAENKLLSLLPQGITDHEIELLDESQYLTLRQYFGLSGYYITNARVLAPDLSDYRYAEDVRVLHKIIRLTRKEALLQLQSDIDMENPESDLAAKAEFIIAKVKKMVELQEISSVSVSVPEDQNLLVTETLLLKVRYVPRGKIRAIEIELGVRNPYAE